MDINKTIVVKDKASGKDTLKGLNSLLSECVWGNFDTTKPLAERNENDWQVITNDPAAFAPIHSNTAKRSEPVTFGNFLEEYTKVPKSTQKALKTEFTSTHGIGRIFAKHYEKLVEQITLPASKLTSEPLPSYFADGFYQIVPSFFLLITFLVLKRIDFRLIFRTFGRDGASVIDEFNAFCEERHPFFKPPQKLDGTDPTYPIDLRLNLPHQSGALLRTSEGDEGVLFSYVDPKNNLIAGQSGAKKFYHTLMKDILRMHLPPSSSDVSGERIPRTFFLQDDFSFWHAHNENDQSGKIMLVPTKRHEKLFEDFSDDIIQIFFDDNIERNYAHIVDVRDIKSFAPIPYSETKDLYLKRVEPWCFLTEQKYYVHSVCDHLRNYYNIHVELPEGF